MRTSGEFADHIFLQLTANVLDRNIIITRVISNEVTTLTPVNGVGGHLYPALNVLCYEETDFVHGHYQSIRPAPIVQPQQPQSPTVTQQYRSQLPSVDSNRIYKAQMSIVMQHVIHLIKILQELEIPENHPIYLLLI